MIHKGLLRLGFLHLFVLISITLIFINCDSDVIDFGIVDVKIKSVFTFINNYLGLTIGTFIAAFFDPLGKIFRSSRRNKSYGKS